MSSETADWCPIAGLSEWLRPRVRDTDCLFSVAEFRGEKMMWMRIISVRSVISSEGPWLYDLPEVQTGPATHWRHYD
jgi:hypothetical protein